VPARQEQQDVAPSGIVVQPVVEESSLRAGIDGGPYAEGAIVPLVGGQVTGKFRPGPVPVRAFHRGAGFFPAASIPFGRVAKGTETRWSRHRCQEATRYGRPSSATNRTAMRITRWVEWLPGGARSERSARKKRPPGRPRCSE
jgi:hypothetical protein